MLTSVTCFYREQLEDSRKMSQKEVTPTQSISSFVNEIDESS